MTYLCIHAADASSQNLWVNTHVPLLLFPQILWICEFLKPQWVMEHDFNTIRTVIPGWDISMQTLTHVVWKICFVRIFVGENLTLKQLFLWFLFIRLKFPLHPTGSSLIDANPIDLFSVWFLNFGTDWAAGQDFLLLLLSTCNVSLVFVLKEALAHPSVLPDECYSSHF